VGVKLQTIGDSKRFLAAELTGIYPPGEAGAVATFLIESVTGLDTMGQLKNGGRELTKPESEKLCKGLIELKKNKPVQHIAGYGWFMGRKFKVNKDVLIPRQETEELIMLTVRKAGNRFSGTIIDFCTGSGCIAITLACALSGAKIIATDISENALRVAAINAKKHNAAVTLLRHNLLSGHFRGLPEANIIVANPPYVKESEKAFMEPRVTGHEPPGALFVPDTDPLIFYRHLLEAMKQLLTPGGWFCFEINEAHGGELLQLFKVPFINNCEIINDIHDKERFICGTGTN
jgi:release factor glutamine methyltransferase